MRIKKRILVQLLGMLSVFSMAVTAVTAVDAANQADPIDDLSRRLELGQIDQVLIEVDRILQKNPQHYEALFLQARVFTLKNKTKQAADIYLKLIKIDAMRPEAYNNLAILLASQGQLEQAQTVLQQGIDTNSTYRTMNENLSILYVEMARTQYGQAMHVETDEKLLGLSEITRLPTDGDLSSTPVAVASAKPNTDVGSNKPLAQDSMQIEEIIITTLQAWAAAWSEQAADVYFIFYADSYSPSGISRAEWKQQRVARITAPKWIKIKLSDIKFVSVSNKEVRVQLIQDYSSNKFSDKSRKEIRLRLNVDGWRIVSEINLPE